MQVKFEIRGVEKLQAYLKTLPRGAVRVALKAFTIYVLGDKSHGLRHDEPQKYVSRKQAGYKTSPAQIRYFFAVGILERVGSGVRLNHYKRSGSTAAAYDYQAVNDWKYKIVNPTAGAYFTRDNEGQTRQHSMAGRRTITKVIMDNMAGGIRSANAAINSWLKSGGK